MMLDESHTTSYLYQYYLQDVSNLRKSVSSATFKFGAKSIQTVHPSALSRHPKDNVTLRPVYENFAPCPPNNFNNNATVRPILKQADRCTHDEIALRPISNINANIKSCYCLLDPCGCFIMHDNISLCSDSKGTLRPGRREIDVFDFKTSLAPCRQVKSSNPLLVAEYVDDIHSYHRKKELQAIVDPRYMELKYPNTINDNFRSLLIDWIVTIHPDGGQCWDHLSSDTLHLTVNILDRFLATTNSHVHRGNLQLIGVACFLIASKYEDIYPPYVKDLICLSDGCFTRQDLYDMEECILKTLCYRLSFPTAITFLAGYLKVAGVSSSDQQTINVANYFLESSLLSYNMLNYLPSQLAAASVLLSCGSSKTIWNARIGYYSGYLYQDIVTVARALWDATVNMPKDRMAVHNKFKSVIKNFESVTTQPPKFMSFWSVTCYGR